VRRLVAAFLLLPGCRRLSAPSDISEDSALAQNESGGGGACENWARGLQAMAGGVPVVTQRQWGWCDMIEHRVTGFLGSEDCELAHSRRYWLATSRSA